MKESLMKVALVGAGGMARLYRSVYARLPKVQWVLAVDVSERELAACKALGASRTSTDFADALASDIDMVDISTPNHLHEEQAVAALNAGKHVLLQKPIASTLAAADRILAAAASSKGRLGMYLSSFNNPLVWEIKRIVAGGHLGEIQSVRARDAHTGGMLAKPSSDNWRSSRELTGGGSFLQLSIHAINLIQWWLESSITEIFAFSANQYSPNVGGDDVTTAVAKLEGGKLALFDSGWASDGMSRELYGTRGSIALRDNDRVLEVKLDAPYRSELVQISQPNQVVSVARPPASEAFDNAENPLNQQRVFIERVSAGQRLLNDGQVGRRDLAVVTAAYESARTGRAVKI
jgi:predicted dehydrogenase